MKFSIIIKHNFLLTRFAKMSLLYHSGIPRSRGSNRNNYQNMGSSVNRRNDVNLISQNYNNYYGNPSVAKDTKLSSINPPSQLSHLTAAGKDSGLLPKISHGTA